MIRSLCHGFIDRFARRYGYDATYMHEIVDTSLPAFVKLGLAQGMSTHRENVPPEALFGARIATVRHEDCGPCAQLVVNMALEAGVDAAVVRAIVAKDFNRMPVDAALGVRLAEATMAHEPADELREQVRTRYGEQGLVTLAYAIAATRIYPTLKRVLGHAHTCERLTVGDDSIVAVRAA
jgi:hypothetical protein